MLHDLTDSSRWDCIYHGICLFYNTSIIIKMIDYADSIEGHPLCPSLLVISTKHSLFYQCSKLRFYIVHTQGAWVAKIVRPAICPCVFPFIKVLIFSKKHAHTGCTGENSVHPAAKICTLGAGCTLNFEHCLM